VPLPQSYAGGLAARRCVEAVVASLRHLRAITFLAIAFSVPVAGQSLGQIKADLDDAAHKIDVLEPLAIGNYPMGPRSATEASQSAAARIAATNYASSFLTALLSDPSAKIRTLALELLFRKQDPQLLPKIFEHATDEDVSFEHVVSFNFRANGPPDSKREKQTVASFCEGDARVLWRARRLSRVLGGATEPALLV
jgi:hypothetical protein